MKFHSLYQPRRPLLWLAVLALFAASCSASTTVDSTASTSDSTESSAEDSRTAQEEPPADEPSPSDDSASDDSTETTDEPASVEDEPIETSEDDAQTDDSDESAETEVVEDEDGVSSDPASAELSVGEASVIVLDPGAEPRTELRMMIAASCTEIMSLTTTQEISQVIDGQQIPSAGPVGNVMEMATSATPVGDNYDVRSEVISAVSTPNTPPAVAASIDAELARIVGLTNFATLTDRAVLVPGSSRVEGAEALGELASLLDGLNQAQSPLPEEAVGAGARWETRSLIELEGLRVTTIVTNELVSIDGTIIELRLDGRQEVDPDSRMTTQGLVGEVTAWEVISTGTTTIDLATINPISMSVTSTGVQGFDFGFGGQLDQEISTEVSSVAQPNDGCTGRSTRG